MQSRNCTALQEINYHNISKPNAIIIMRGKKMSILFAILIFEAIIIIHELGHFIAAKASGVKINEFAIGMGPAIIKKKKGDTLYAWRVFPIGGYCAMEGEDNGSEDGGAFCNKSLPKRMLIVVAGVIMNLVLGYIILCISTARSDGIATTLYRGLRITLCPNRPACRWVDDNRGRISHEDLHYYGYVLSVWQR